MSSNIRSSIESLSGITAVHEIHEPILIYKFMEFRRLALFIHMCIGLNTHSDYSHMWYNQECNVV